MIDVAAAIQWLPIGAWGIRAIILGLNEWFRKSELSCDRAGLLCSQDPSAALRVHASLAGARNPDDLDIAAFLDQAEEYENHGDVRDSLLKLLQISGQTHPLAALRAAELHRGRRSRLHRDPGRELPTALGGQGRTDERGGQGCRRLVNKNFTTSGDPLYKLVGKIGSVAGAAGGSAANRIRDMWRSGQGGGSNS